MFKHYLIAPVLLAICAPLAAAAQPAVPDETLTAMGIRHMEPLSDTAGQAVRGKGTFANVWGSSEARWGSQASSNSYSAGSSWLGKGSSAMGSSFSYGGNLKASFGGFGRFGR